MRTRELAAALGATHEGEDREVGGLAAIGTAGPAHVVGAFEPRYRDAARTTDAGAAIVSDLPVPDTCTRLGFPDAASARRAFGAALRLLHPRPVLQPPPVGIDPRAAVDPEAWIADDAAIGPFVHIGPGAVVETGAVLHAGTTVGARAFVGPRSVLHPRAAVLDGCRVGEDVLLCTGAVVGSPGFGIDADGRLPHPGVAVVDDRVTIGANSCVDRATVGETRIGADTHLDNLVQVGHNARVGERVVLCGQVGLAGGAVVEDGAVIGGQAGVNGYVTVGPGTRVAAQSGVTRSIGPGGDFSGHPAEPNRRRLRRIARLRKLVDP